MNIVKTLCATGFAITLGLGPAQAATVRLLDADLGAAAAYFSQLTGNSYIVEFDAQDKISTSRDDVDGAAEIHQLFVDLTRDLGAEMRETAPNRYVITAPQPAPVVVPAITVSRIELEGKISQAGIKNLIATIPALQQVEVIENIPDERAILVAGSQDAVDQLGAIIASLPQPKPAATSRAATPTAAAPQPTTTVDTPAAIPTTWTEVVDLSFADAGELVANLQPLLAGSTMGGTVNIAAHASANQVIVSGLYDDMAAILAVIEKLDRTPRQVYVDAIIAEVSEDTASRLGLQFSINSDNLAASVVTGVTGINIGSAAGDPFLAGAAGGVIAAGRGANAIPDIGVMLAALQGDTDNRILATPSLMTTENKESTILVGQNVPFITGQFTNGEGDGARPFQTIKREDLGTSLKIKPKIGPQGNIVMEIWQEVSRIDQSTPGLSDVVTVKRQISTVVTAEQGETIAIGGLRVEQQELAISKVPVLGDIPILGAAFRQEVSNTVSRNLAIFLRPTLVNTKDQRRSVVQIWENTLGPGLFETGGSKSKFFDPKPVGVRLPQTSLRPKPRP